MSIDPLLAAPAAVQLHTVVALLAFVLGVVQLALPKGTLQHRQLGWVWVALMGIICVSSFFIHEMRIWGPWSPIHVLAIAILVAIIAAVVAARRHAIGLHRAIMTGVFAAGMLLTGAFTLAPGRIMHAVVFGS